MKRRTLAMLALATLVAAAGACGGKLGDESESEERDAEKEGTGGRAEDDDDAQAGTGGGLMNDRTLEACKLGSHRQAGKACPYMTEDNHCYESANAACDCACPRGGSGELVCVQVGGNSDSIVVFCETT